MKLSEKEILQGLLRNVKRTHLYVDLFILLFPNRRAHKALKYLRKAQAQLNRRLEEVNNANS